MEKTLLASPLMQFGFAGFSLLLLAVIVWLIRQLIVIIQKNNSVLAKLTDMIHMTNGSNERVLEMTTKMHEELMRRPCLVPRSRRAGE